MEPFYPMKLRGVTKSPIWGGRRLLDGWGKTADSPTVGESWELTVREKENSVVTNGAFAGRTLASLIEEFPEEIVGDTDLCGNFPLLIKLIDAADRLSVQVHPDDAYAAKIEGDRGKTEMWYIVEADPDAEIICGLCDGVDRATLRQAIADGTVEKVLIHKKVHPGETYFIPAGLPHAIGRGILIAEIQQNCDLTYRVYDYLRRQPDGSLRELHVDKALDVIRPFTDEEIDRLRFSAATGDRSPDLLADSRYFRVRRLVGEFTLPRASGMRHLLVIGGEGELICGGSRLAVGRGDSVFLPAALPPVAVTGNGEFLLSEGKPKK